MANLFKKYIKPFLKSIGIYDCVYRVFFMVLSATSYPINVFGSIFRATTPILLYHRIDTLTNDPVMLAVTPKCFEEHLIFLKKNYDVIPLYELSVRIATKKLKGNEAAITFDDGYKDNLTNALPLLEKHRIPATLFITTNLIGQKSSFAWDMKYSETDRATFLNSTDIKVLSDNPFIEIGAHTESHQKLANLTPKKQKEDILEGKTKLENIIGKNVRLFAYPFGGSYDFDSTTEKIVRELGFDFAYSNTQRLAHASKNTLRIPRINIRECSLQSLAKKLCHFNFRVI